MPLYDYLCAKCGAVTEVRHGAGEKFTGACAACGSTALRRVFNAAPIHFKGSGFYATDSKKKSEPAKTEAKPSEGDATTRKAEGAKSKESAPSKDSPPTKPSGESAA